MTPTDTATTRPARQSGLLHTTGDHRAVTDQTRFNSCSATLINDFTITIPFNGSSIQIFGGISGVHDLYAVSLDGGPRESFNGSTDLNLGYNSRRQCLSIAPALPGP